VTISAIEEGTPASEEAAKAKKKSMTSEKRRAAILWRRPQSISGEGK